MRIEWKSSRTRGARRLLRGRNANRSMTLVEDSHRARADPDAASARVVGNPLQALQFRLTVFPEGLRSMA